MDIDEPPKTSQPSNNNLNSNQNVSNSSNNSKIGANYFENLAKQLRDEKKSII